VYDRTDEERTLTFDFGEGLLKDNLLVVDRETDSVWSQLHGKAISGPLAGRPMKVVAALQTTWGYWRSLHPETLVVRIEGLRARPYRYRSPATEPGATGHDTRDLGLGLVHKGEKLFASLDALAGQDEPLAITLGGEGITLHTEPDGLTAWAEDGQGQLLPGVLAYRQGWLDFHPDSRLLSQDKKQEQAVLEVRALANEGFLLSAGDDVVAIDAFVSEPYSGYAALSGEPLAALVGGTGPFASLDVALVSHHHRDHFQGEPAQRLLAARPTCLLASSPQVVDALWNTSTEAADGVPADTIRTFLPEPGQEDLLEVGEIRIELLRLSHGTGRFASVQNLGHVITVGGVTALHVGDAVMVPENFAAYHLRERGIDVAFVPYWYFDDPAGRRIVDEHFRPAQLVACHIPPRELEAVTRRLAKSHPDVLVPQKPLELFRIRDEN